MKILAVVLSVLLNACPGWSRKWNPPSSAPGVPVDADSLRYPDHLSFPVFFSPPHPRVEIQALSESARGGRLTSQSHHDSPAHGGEIQISDPIGWKASPGPGRKVWGARSGHGEDIRKTRWILWEEGDSLRVLSEDLQAPLSFPRPGKDVLIHPPILRLDGNLRLYHWRKSQKGYSLHRTSLPVGNPGPGKALEEKVLEAVDEPLFTVAAPILDASIGKKPEEAGEILGWLSVTADSVGGSGAGSPGTVAHIGRIESKAVFHFESDRLGNRDPHPRQRLQVYGSVDGTNRLGLLANLASKNLSQAFIFSPAPGSMDRSPRPIVQETPLQSSRIHSAAVIARLAPDAEPVIFILSPSGNLYWSLGSTLRRIRQGVPLDYNFPIFASGLRTYEARFDRKGRIFFDSVP